MVDWVSIGRFCLDLIGRICPPSLINHLIVDKAHIDQQIDSLRTAILEEIAKYHDSFDTLEKLRGENLRPLRRDRLDQETLQMLKELNDEAESKSKKSDSPKVQVLPLRNLLKNFHYLLDIKLLRLSEEYLIDPKLAARELESGERLRQPPDGGTAAQSDPESLESNNDVNALSSTFWDRVWSFYFMKNNISETLLLIKPITEKLSEKAKGIEKIWEEERTSTSTTPPRATSSSVRVSSESTPGLDGGFEMQRLG